MTRVRCRVGVRRLTRRSKINCTWSGRPMSRFSRITSSKKTRPASGRSKTSVTGEFGLQHRDVVADALLAVAGRKRVRQPGQPLAQQRVDLVGRQAVGQPLHLLRGPRRRRMPLSSGSNPMPPFRQLALQILVAVDAELRVVTGSRNRTSGRTARSRRRTRRSRSGSPIAVESTSHA